MDNKSLVALATLSVAALVGYGLGITCSQSKKQLVSSIPKLTLYYFDIKGKAEGVRLACAYGGVPLNDVRINDEMFAKLKSEGKLPFGQVPVLYVNDNAPICQSSAIAKFVGRYTSLYPIEDALMCAKIDAILDSEIDLFMGISVSRYQARYGFAAVDADTMIQVRKSLNDEVLPRHLQSFEKMLSQSTSGWLAGGPTPSIADFMVVPRFEWLIQPGVHAGISTTILDGYPRILKLIKQFNDLSAVRTYYSK